MLKRAGKATDPINIAIQVARGTGKAAGYVGAEGLGLLTGVGGAAVREAARTGALGGYVAERFREAMRGNLPLEEVVEEAQSAMKVLREQRTFAYRADMMALSKDKSVLGFGPINVALRKIDGMQTFKGVSLSPSTNAIRKRIGKTVAKWKKRDPAEYHTPEGMDALKKQIGDIRDNTAFGTPERAVASTAYDAIRKVIIAQAPEYGKTMRAYEQATRQINNITQSLSLGEKALPETALRKLQSIMRNEVSSAFGKRAEYGKVLEEAGATGLMPALAGQAMSAKLPRGMSRAVGAGAGATGLAVNPMMLGALPFMSPRLVGEAVHGAARAAAPVTNMVRGAGRRLPQGAGLAAFQTGRASREREDDAIRASLIDAGDAIQDLAIAGR